MMLNQLLQETRLKGYINVRGYRVTVDETLDPGRYCFRIDHDHDKTHFFSSDQKLDLREWMKAIMKATIGRDYTSKSSVIFSVTFAHGLSRACRFFLQYPDDPLGRGSGYEPST